MSRVLAAFAAIALPAGLAMAQVATEPALLPGRSCSSRPPANALGVVAVPANAVPILAPLFRPDCFWFAPQETIPLPTPIVIPWQYVGFYAGLVVLDGGGAATVTHTVPDLTGWIGPAGYEDLLVQGVVLASGAPAPSFGTTQAVRLFVHR